MHSAARKNKSLRRATGLLRESLREHDHDLTRIPLRRALGLLAIPMMLEVSMESVFAIVDIAFVSRLGTDAIAAVGITEAVVTVLFAIAIGLGLSVTAVVSRRIGEQDPGAAALATGQAIWIAAALSVVIGIAGSARSTDILRLMGASDSVIETGSGFTAVMLGGSATIFYLFLLNAAFRGVGDAAVALRSLWLANGLNIVLDPCLIFGLGPFPEMGVTGAAVATNLGRGTGVLYQLWYLSRDRGRLVVRPRHLRVDPATILQILRLSVGGIGQFLITTSSWIVVMRVVAVYGSAAVAAYTVALRTLEFAWLPAWGLGNAAATLVGQNLGARRVRRAVQAAWLAARYNMVFMICVGLVMIGFAPAIVGLFSADPQVVATGISCLRILGVGFPMYAVGMIMTQVLNGAGDTTAPAAINFVCFWLLQIPLAHGLAAGAGMGPDGAFAAIVISESLLTVLAVIAFRRGRWQRRRV